MNPCMGCGASSYIEQNQYMICSYCKRISTEKPIHLRTGITQRLDNSFYYSGSATFACSYAFMDTRAIYI